MGNPTRQYLISGRVQGVGFRAHAQRWAQRLSVMGWVRNLVDGRVEVIAQAAQSVLVEFEIQLRRGPEFSRVSDFHADSWEQAEVYSVFEVRKDGEEPCGRE